MMEQPIGPSLW